MNNIRYPVDCKAIIDVTKPPYSCDNTGKTDCTKQLCQIIDDIMGAYGNATIAAKEKLETMEDPNAMISFEIRKLDGRINAVFPEILPNAKTIYFPNGTYLVSDTISYSFEEFRNVLFNLRWLEMNSQLRFMGQSRDGVVIKLQDNCKGFEHGQDRPVICFMQGEASNIAMTNMLENLTIDVGSGNPGATGVRYFANNTGAIRNVKIISSDPEFRGHTGFSILHEKVSAGYVQNLEVVGFNYGIRVMPQAQYALFEHLRISNQKRTGIHIGNTIVTIRDLVSENSVCAVKMDGVTGLVSLIDAKLTGGDPNEQAIRHNYGHVFLRNIETEGYEFALSPHFWSREQDKDSFVGSINEYSYPALMQLFDDKNHHSLRLPVPETPVVPWHNPEDWVSVNSFGAKGDGVTDDTAAIQEALNSGKPSVYFQPGHYLINAPITIPASVERVNFMYGDLISGKALSAKEHTGAFVIKEYSDKPLLFEDLFAWEKFFGFMTLIEHACTRTLITSDVHVQTASIYFNTVPGGKVFMENTGCTIGGIPGAGVRTQKLPHEDDFPYSRETPCFAFTGQEVYCRQLNPERSLHEVVNDGGKLWIIGGKTEEEGTAYETKNGGHTELYGITFCIGLNKPYPIIINDNSNVSVFAGTFLMNTPQQWPIAVREIRKDESKELLRADMPIRFMDSYMVPYVGRSDDSRLIDTDAESGEKKNSFYI